MSEYTTVSLRKEFVADVEEYIEDEPFGSVKEFVKHLVVQEMESDDEISEGRLVGSVRNSEIWGIWVSGMAGERAVGLPDRLSRADLILACMPLLFAAGYILGAAAFDARPAATAIAAIAGCLPMIDGLFRNPP